MEQFNAAQEAINNMSEKELRELEKANDELFSGLSVGMNRHERRKAEKLERTNKATMRETVLDELIADADKELEDGWVSVEDALPHEEGAVICYFSDGVIETFMFDRHDVDGIWGVHNVVVTHWQPLPAQPMEVNDE